MGAPKGNSFWKQRSKHGRDKIFKTADILWEAATEYFDWCDENPWYKNEAIKGGDMAGELVQIPTARPYTLSGLTVFLGVHTLYLNSFKESLIGKEDQGTKDFSMVISRIEEIIRTQKYEGAAVGAFNANIIARDLGLADKRELGGEVGLKHITGMEVL
jgi:hypothetical protein